MASKNHPNQKNQINIKPIFKVNRLQIIKTKTEEKNDNLKQKMMMIMITQTNNNMIKQAASILLKSMTKYNKKPLAQMPMCTQTQTILKIILIRTKQINKFNRITKSKYMNLNNK